MYLEYLAQCWLRANAQTMLFYLLGSYVIIPIQRMSKSRPRRALCHQQLAEHIHPGLSAYGSETQRLCCNVRLLKQPPAQSRRGTWFLQGGPWVDGYGRQNSEVALKISRPWCACPAKSLSWSVNMMDVTLMIQLLTS